MKISFIYFDLDDTILDHTTSERLAQLDTYNSIKELRVIGFDVWISTYKKINKALWEAYGNGDIDKSTLQDSRFPNTLRELGLPVKHAQLVRNTYINLYKKHWTWNKYAKEALAETARVFPVGMLTNGFAEIQRQKIERFDLNKYFKTTVISELTGFAKPQRGIYDVAAEKAGYLPEQILYIGDNYSADIVGSKEAGWKNIWYNKNKLTIDSSSADFVISHFDQLPALLNAEIQKA